MAFETDLKPPMYPSANAEAASNGRCWNRYERELKAYNEAMSDALESALPVVNIGVIGTIYKINGSMFIDGVNNDDELKPGEVVPLPGWGLQIVMSNGWQPTYKNPDNSGCEQPSEPEAYRLVRLESDKITPAHFNGKQPENSAHGYAEGSEPIKVDAVQWQDIMTTAAGIEPESAPSPIEAKTQENQEELFREMLDELYRLESSTKLAVLDLPRRWILTRK